MNDPDSLSASTTRMRIGYVPSRRMAGDLRTVGSSFHPVRTTIDYWWFSGCAKTHQSLVLPPRDIPRSLYRQGRSRWVNSCERRSTRVNAVPHSSGKDRMEWSENICLRRLDSERSQIIDRFAFRGKVGQFAPPFRTVSRNV